MEEDKAVPHQRVKLIAERALLIERYILRRAWGLCYAVIASEIALITLLPLLLGVVGLSSDYSFVARLAVNTAVSVIGLAVVARIFKMSYAAMVVRREIRDLMWAKMLRPSWAAAVWLIYYMPIVLAIVFLRPIAFLVLFGLLAASSFSFYYVLKVSFPERLPWEAMAVIVAFIFCTLGNLTLFLLKANYASYLALWSIMIAVSLLAAVIAYRQKAPNPLEDIS